MFKKIRGFLNSDKVDRDQGKSLTSASSAKELKSSFDGIMHDAKVQRQNREDALEGARQLLVKDVASRLDDPLHIAILNEIFLDGGRASLNVKTLAKKLRQYDNEPLRALFGALILFRKECAWGAIVKGKNKSGWCGKVNATEQAYGYAEDVLVALCEVGFPPNRDMATLILEFVSTTEHYQAPYVLISDYWKMSILRYLAKVFPNHSDLPATAQSFASSIAQATFFNKTSSSKSPLSAGGKVLPKHNAMMTLAGIYEENLLAQMRREPLPLLGHPDPRGHYASWLPDLHRLQDKAQELADEFVSEDGKPAWLLNEAEYARLFGTFEAESDAFGWWRKPHPKGAGAAILSSETYARMCEPDAYRDSYDWADALENLLNRGTDKLAFTYGMDVVPDIEAFTFEDADPEGDFLTHLATATAAKPTAAWRKATEEHIKRIGANQVQRGLLRWLSHAIELEDVYFENLTSDNLPHAARVVVQDHRKRGNSVPFSKRETPGIQALNREALHLIKMPWTIQKPVLDGHRFHLNRFHEERRHKGPVSHVNVSVMSGVFWTLAGWSDSLTVMGIERAAHFCFKKFRGNFRTRKAGNAALWALGQIGSKEAVYMLARLRRAVVRDKAISKQVDKALTDTGSKIGLSLDDMKELSADDWSVADGGVRIERLGDIAVTLKVVSSRSVTLESRPWDTPDAPSKRGVIKAALVDEQAKEIAAELKAAAKDIPRLLPEVRARFELSMRTKRDWAWDDFHERFVVNRLVATLTRRIIWSLNWPDGVVMEALFVDDGFVDVHGNAITKPFDDARISVWHPLAESRTDAVAWADRLAILGIRQPFAQAWRTVYLMTPPEHETRTYSNRFSGHILHQPPLIAILRKKGWHAGSRMGHAENPEKARNWIDLPAYEVRAEYWVSGIGTAEAPNHAYGADNYEYVVADRVQFYRLNSDGNAAMAPLPLKEVDPRAFSEAFGDIEAVVGLTSIGRDKFWQDLGADAIRPSNLPQEAAAYRQKFTTRGSKEMIEQRNQILALLLPKLSLGKVAELTSDGLKVLGSSGNQYTIHLGSAAVIKHPGPHHICIVPVKENDSHQPILPFEGDAVFAEILSKAVMLAEDLAIKNPDIRKQIHI